MGSGLVNCLSLGESEERVSIDILYKYLQFINEKYPENYCLHICVVIRRLLVPRNTNIWEV